MELNAAVVFILVMDTNKWAAVKANATRNSITEQEALSNASKEVVIENYDYSMVVEWADALYNWLQAN